MKIVNLTQHDPTPEQARAGVVDLATAQRAVLRGLLTFDTLPAAPEITRRAAAIADLATGYGSAMIGGVPFLMSALEHALRARDVQPLYAFSERISTEEAQPDGSVRKVQIFRHQGFVAPPRSA